MIWLLMWHGLQLVKLLLRLVLHLGLLIWLHDRGLIWRLRMVQTLVWVALWIVDIRMRLRVRHVD